MFRNVLVGVDRHLDDRDAVALELLTAARDRARVSADLRYVESSSAGRGLHELAEPIGPDLLVVGSSGRGLLGRVLLADDTREAVNGEALNGVPCAVAIAPSGYALKPVSIRVIGVAYDGSADSEHAVSVAMVLATELGARLSGCEAIALPVYTFLIGRLVHGSTSSQLARTARSPLLVLPRAAPEPDLEPAPALKPSAAKHAYSA
jgi:nucleotide-binding universal stress UspA family protein